MGWELAGGTKGGSALSREVIPRNTHTLTFATFGLVRKDLPKDFSFALQKPLFKWHFLNTPSQHGQPAKTIQCHKQPKEPRMCSYA